MRIRAAVFKTAALPIRSSPPEVPNIQIFTFLVNKFFAGIEYFSETFLPASSSSDQWHRVDKLHRNKSN